MKKRVFMLTFVLLLISVNAFAQAGSCTITGSSPSGGLYFYKALIGSGTDDSPYLFANTGRKLYFGTNGVTATPKMVIDTAGNVGIGTTAPQTSLHVNGDITLGDNTATLKGIHMGANNGWLGLSGGGVLNSPSNGAYLNLFGNQIVGTDGGVWRNLNGSLILSAGQQDSGGYGGIIFFNTSGATNMTILPSGNVGIGTTTPAAKLDIAGQVKISGGSPGAGKVLTSDANGLATWQTPLGAAINVYKTSTGQLTVNSTYTTTACMGSSIYYACDGVTCNATTPKTCNNTYVGKLVP